MVCLAVLAADLAPPGEAGGSRTTEHSCAEPLPRQQGVLPLHTDGGGQHRRDLSVPLPGQ